MVIYFNARPSTRVCNLRVLAKDLNIRPTSKTIVLLKLLTPITQVLCPSRVAKPRNSGTANRRRDFWCKLNGSSRSDDATETH